MLQRIGFLATILHDPRLIILDEPLSGLDPIGRKELKDVIIEVHRQGKTVFFSSHIVPDIEEICDRVIFLKQGKLSYDGRVSDLLMTNKSENYLIRLSRAIDFPGAVFTPSDNQQSVTAVVNEHHKRQFIEEVISQGADILSLEKKRSSLEEIFYNTRE